MCFWCTIDIHHWYQFDINKISCAHWVSSTAHEWDKKHSDTTETLQTITRHLCHLGGQATIHNISAVERFIIAFTRPQKSTQPLSPTGTSSYNGLPHSHLAIISVLIHGLYKLNFHFPQNHFLDRLNTHSTESHFSSGNQPVYSTLCE